MLSIDFSYAEFYHIALGMLLMMFAYITVNWVQIRQTIYLYYGVYIGLQWGYFALMQGDILSGNALQTTWLLLATRCCVWVLYNLFAADFLRLKKRNSWLFRYTRLNITLAIATFFAMSSCYLFGKAELAKSLVDSVKIIIYVFGIIVVFKVLKWKDLPSRYFVMGSLILMSCEIINILLMKTCHTDLGFAKLQHLSTTNVLAHPCFFSIIGVMSDVILLTLGLVHQHRESALENLRAEYEKHRALEQERNRIARDMHDDLGSGLSALQMMSQVAAHTSQQPEMMQTSVERIATLSQELNQRVREIVWTTSSDADTLPSLIYYLRRFAADFTDTQHIDFQTDIPNELPEIPLTGNIRRNVFLCVKEVLNNSLKYANATKITMAVRIERHKLVMDFADNGQGFDFVIAEKKGGNGLRNLQQRMQEIDGDIHFYNENGTRVSIRFPYFNGENFE